MNDRIKCDFVINNTAVPFVKNIAAEYERSLKPEIELQTNIILSIIINTDSKSTSSCDR